MYIYIENIQNVNIFISFKRIHFRIKKYEKNLVYKNIKLN